MSRAEWLALGSTLALAGCTPVTSSSGGTPADAMAGGHDAPATPPVDDATAKPQGDLEAGAADAEAGADDATDDAAPTGPGLLACGTVECDPAKELCLTWSYVNSSPVWECAPIPMQCMPNPSCACISQYATSPCGSVYTCDFDGGFTAVTSNCGCYGAPPVRLERLLA